jgi:hypothetical protein
MDKADTAFHLSDLDPPFAEFLSAVFPRPDPPERPDRWTVEMDDGGVFEGDVTYSLDGQGFVQPPVGGWPRNYAARAIKVPVKTVLSTHFGIK